MQVQPNKPPQQLSLTTSLTKFHQILAKTSLLLSLHSYLQNNNQQQQGTNIDNANGIQCFSSANLLLIRQVFDIFRIIREGGGVQQVCQGVKVCDKSIKLLQIRLIDAIQLIMKGQLNKSQQLPDTQSLYQQFYIKCSKYLNKNNQQITTLCKHLSSQAQSTITQTFQSQTQQLTQQATQLLTTSQLNSNNPQLLRNILQKIIKIKKTYQTQILVREKQVIRYENQIQILKEELENVGNQRDQLLEDLWEVQEGLQSGQLEAVKEIFQRRNILSQQQLNKINKNKNSPKTDKISSLTEQLTQLTNKNSQLISQAIDYQSQISNLQKSLLSYTTQTPRLPTKATQNMSTQLQKQTQKLQKQNKQLLQQNQAYKLKLQQYKEEIVRAVQVISIQNREIVINQEQLEEYQACQSSKLVSQLQRQKQRRSSSRVSSGMSGGGLGTGFIDLADSSMSFNPKSTQKLYQKNTSTKKGNPISIPSSILAMRNNQNNTLRINRLSYPNNNRRQLNASTNNDNSNNSITNTNTNNNINTNIHNYQPSSNRLVRKKAPELLTYHKNLNNNNISFNIKQDYYDNLFAHVNIKIPNHI